MRYVILFKVSVKSSELEILRSGFAMPSASLIPLVRQHSTLLPLAIFPLSISLGFLPERSTLFFDDLSSPHGNFNPLFFEKI